jgi:hypothetical protein
MAKFFVQSFANGSKKLVDGSGYSWLVLADLNLHFTVA